MSPLFQDLTLQQVVFISFLLLAPLTLGRENHPPPKNLTLCPPVFRHKDIEMIKNNLTIGANSMGSKKVVDTEEKVFTSPQNTPLLISKCDSFESFSKSEAACKSLSGSEYQPSKIEDVGKVYVIAQEIVDFPTVAFSLKKKSTGLFFGAQHNFPCNRPVDDGISYSHIVVTRTSDKTNFEIYDLSKSFDQITKSVYICEIKQYDFNM